MKRGLGPRADFVYGVLRASILGGEYPPGSRIPAHSELAARFGVAIMTVRQACARLEHEGLIVSRQGRGTFVQAEPAPAVLIVDPDPAVRATLCSYVERTGYRAVETGSPDEALATLQREGAWPRVPTPEGTGAHVLPKPSTGHPSEGQNDRSAMALVLTGSRLPTKEDGITFMRAVYRRRPDLIVAAVATDLQDLVELQGTAECPVLVVSSPVRARQIEDVVRLVLHAWPERHQTWNDLPPSHAMPDSA